MKQITVVEEDDIERLEKIRSVIYQFLVPGTMDGLDKLELKPKTYTEAVKCYLEVDSRIDEKSGKGSSLGFDRWEEVFLHCLSSPEEMKRGVKNQLMTDSDEASFSNAKPAA